MKPHAHATREPRSRRRSSPVALGRRERDRWILEALAKMRFLTSTQIAKLFFGGSRSITNRRLRRLFDAGLVRVWVRNLAQDNVYALAPSGRNDLEEFEDPAASLSCPRRLDGQLDHLLAINSVRIALAMSLTDGVLAWWQSDWELRRYGSDESVSDARFAISWPGTGELRYALEVEYHTRSPRTFLRKMLRRARTQTGALRNRTDDAMVLVVGRHPSWVERYRQAVATLTIGHGVWFSTLTEVEQEGADAAIWRPASGEQSAQLRALTNCPYGNGSWPPENDAAAQPSAAQTPQTCPSKTP